MQIKRDGKMRATFLASSVSISATPSTSVVELEVGVRSRVFQSGQEKHPKNLRKLKTATRSAQA
jgi:hypothetical protein